MMMVLTLLRFRHLQPDHCHRLSHHAVLFSPQLCADASYYRWDYLLLALHCCSKPRVFVFVIVGFDLQFHSEERGTHHIKLHEFCGGDGDIDAIVQRHLSVRINHTKLFILFYPKFPDCDSPLQRLAGSGLAGVYGRGVMRPSLCFNPGISSANE